MIEPGQVYYSLDPRIEQYYDAPRRIKIVSEMITTPGLHGFGKVDVVTLTDDGREIRRRSILTTQLHAGPIGESGRRLKHGYALEVEAE